MADKSEDEACFGCADEKEENEIFPPGVNYYSFQQPIPEPPQRFSRLVGQRTGPTDVTIPAIEVKPEEIVDTDQPKYKKVRYDPTSGNIHRT